MNDKTWSSVESYYLDNGLSEIKFNRSELKMQNQFSEVTLSNVCSSPSITAILIDEDAKEIFCSSMEQFSRLKNLIKLDTLISQKMTLSDIHLIKDDRMLLLDIGILAPNDYATGSIKQLNLKDKSVDLLVDSLLRPVHMFAAEGNWYISEHGNTNGRFSEFNLPDRRSLPQVPLPGVYKAIEVDIENDGKLEILLQVGQAKEGIYVWAQDRSLEPLLEFPPEFGLSDLDTADFNGDGFIDFVITNGDNADYSVMPKAYHGVRIYLNDGQGSYFEKCFYPMYGASQVKCFDANGDDKVDIVASSYFPLEVDQSVVYLEQKESSCTFEAYGFENANKGRWLVMERGDIDLDGDLDLVLGSFINGPTKIKGNTLDAWIKESVDLLILKNKEHN